MRLLLPILTLAIFFVSPAIADQPKGDQLVDEYFRIQTEKISEATFKDIHTAEDWNARKSIYREQLFEMLGLTPRPPKSPLHATITGTVEEEDFVVENLHFQSREGLYVTGNLYRPKEVDKPLPAILYVCGHGRVKMDGVSYGNKTHYQHHGAWFARNGYVCLTIDTIQLGEIEGIHHGTYREKRWWWNQRGYTPAGVEAWNCIRALDYLQSRDEVDGDRIGVTGRSGGGAYSWWVAALDERVKVAVPVAGITSLKNHVVDGCVEGHCDCMYMLNTYRWDFAKVAALVAPRPLLITNTDKDRIFPLDGVVDVYQKTRKIYDLHDATALLGLQISEGPHKDTQELRVAAFRWFNKHLKGDESLIETTATKFFEPQQLKVFETLPEDEIVTTVDETFVAKTKSDSNLAQARELIREKCLGGWPHENEAEPLDVKQVGQFTDGGVTLVQYEFTSQTPYRLSFWVAGVDDQKTLSSNNSSRACFLNQSDWVKTRRLFDLTRSARPSDAANNESEKSNDTIDESWPTDVVWKKVVDQVHAVSPSPLVFFMPRNVGPTKWSDDERVATHIERRFMLLGQSTEAMQAYDCYRAIQALRSIPTFENRKVDLLGTPTSHSMTRLAAFMSDNVGEVKLSSPWKRVDLPGGIPQFDRYGVDETLTDLADQYCDRYFQAPIAVEVLNWSEPKTGFDPSR